MVIVILKLLNDSVASIPGFANADITRLVLSGYECVTEMGRDTHYAQTLRFCVVRGKAV
jgi:hypothetical protein